MARISLLLVCSALFLSVAATPARAAGSWAWPVRGDLITSYRNGADPYAGGQHRGIDIASPVGRAVAAPTAGRITFAGTAGSSGLTVSLRTADGRWDTSYLHLASLSVRKGDRVSAGGRLGAVGTTGRRSAERPHLHFGVREAGSRHGYRDPLDFLAPLGGPSQARPGPAGAPLPVPRGPKPAPAAAPAPTPGPSPAGSRVPEPAGAPGRAPAPAPWRAGSAVARALAPAALGPAPEPRRAAHGAAPAKSAAPATAHGAAAGHTPAFTPHGGGAPAPAISGSVRTRAPAAGGFDLGWALACFGVAAAALALGKPIRGQKPRARLGTAALRVFEGWPTTSRPRSTT